MRLHDTVRGEVVPFEPGPEVSMYVCGITPYDATHLGHAFTYLTFDLVVRRLEDLGHEVHMVRNVTDVDDSILPKARELKVDYQALAAVEMAHFEADMEALNMRPAAVEPWATETIDEMHDLIQRLSDNGHTYTVDGTTYFDVSTSENFGSLSGYDEATMRDLAAERGGHPDDPRPVNNVVPAWDLVCGQMAAVGLLAAERRRLLEGVGDLVTLALADVALATVGMLGNLAEAEVLGTQRDAVGNDLYGAYGSDFPTVDGRRVMVVAISPKQWRGLQAATGTTDEVAALAGELGVDFADEGERYLARDRLRQLFTPWFAGRTLDEVAGVLDAEGVCWGPYRTFLEMLDEDPRCSTANPLFAALDQPGVGRHLVPGSPLAFAGNDDRGSATAPRLGEHTEQVLADDLGLGAAEVTALVDRGVVATAG